MNRTSLASLPVLVTKVRRPLTIAAGILALLMIDNRPLWPGMLVAVIGEIIQLWAASHLHKNQNLATSGPYAYVRNPMYFGRFFVGLGIILMIGNVWIISAYLLYYLVYVTGRVDGEEARLEGIFGEAYTDYKAEVRRFLPRFTPYSKSSGAKAEWSSIARNHEYRNAIGLVLYFAVLCLRLEYVGDIIRWV